MRLNQTRAPQLPVAPADYAQQERDKYSNILRLYFNTIDTTFANLLNGDNAGGKYLLFPYAAIQRTTDKTFTANTATQITFNQNDFLNGCTNDGTDGIHVEQPGIYNYQFSIQFANTDTQIHAAWVWLRVNGVDVPGTASRWDITAKHGSSDGYVVAAANFFVELQANDTVEMWAAVDNTGIYMEAYAASVSPFARPSIPSVVATLSFVSNLAS
jgi:hypothetical protein